VARTKSHNCAKLARAFAAKMRAVGGETRAITAMQGSTPTGIGLKTLCYHFEEDRFAFS